MAKLQWIKWYPDDWMRDTRSLSIEAKGCLIDILMLMWNAPIRGLWEGSYQEFARVTGSPWEAAQAIITELQKVVTVTHRDKIVTLENRRMRRQDLNYKNNAIRQSRWRRNALRNASVTDKTPQDSSRLHKNTPLTKKDFFTKPSAQDVTAYGASIGFRIDGAEFCDFYESKGWKVGTAPMRSWQAAVRTWKKRAAPSAMILPPRPVQPKPVEQEPTEEERQEAIRVFQDFKRTRILTNIKTIPQPTEADLEAEKQRMS